MSADLFAEFGAPNPISLAQEDASRGTPVLEKTAAGILPTGSSKPALTNTAPVSSFTPAASTEDDEDDFGEFEEPARKVSALHTGQHEISGAVRNGNETVSDIGAVPRFDQTFPRQSQSRDPNILFDTEDPDEVLWREVEARQNEDDDDFGDFENVDQVAEAKKTVNIPNQTQREPEMDLLGLEDETVVQVRASKSTAVRTKQPTVTKTMASRPKVSRADLNDQARQDPDTSADDPWDDFETSFASTAIEPHQTEQIPQSPSSLAPPTHLVAGLSQPSPSGATPLPPTNIPPPSVVLSIFPPIFTEVSTSFLQLLTSLAQSERTILLLTPPTPTFLHAYHLLATTFAHILAGRRLRWKRDKHLAQSMSIGPSVSGRSGGMKLAGLDRSEASHEDREAVEALRVWKASTGRLRSVISAFNAAATATSGAVMPLPQVLELMETMPVRTAKAGEGAVVSLAACALCGLRREERVPKVDVGVEDSFGEWWVEGTNMHLACYNFWEANKGKLRSR